MAERPSNERVEVDPTNSTSGVSPSTSSSAEVRSMTANIDDNIWNNNDANVDPGMSFSENLLDLGHLLTQLVNAVESNGLPPLSREKIAALPKSAITADDAATKIDCTICLDDFRLDDVVCKLPCSHTYHEHCIKVWLELHNSCPICRKMVASYERPSTSARARRNRYTNFDGEIEIEEVEL